MPVTPNRRRRAPAALAALLAFAAGLAGAQEPPARSPETQHAIAVMITNCSDDQRQMFASGLRRPQYLLFCNCYVYSALDALDDDELAYRHAHGDAPSPRFIDISGKLVDACVREARARLPD
jgi:hypothetical protein